MSILKVNTADPADQAAKLNIEITKPTQQNGYRTGNV